MVSPGVYSGRTKPKQMSHSFHETPNSSKTLPLTDHLSTNLTLKFDTNVRLQRNTVLATVTIVNAFVTAALIAAAVPTGAYIQNELNNSQHKIIVLQEQVKFLTDRYEYILKQLRSVRILSKRSSFNENLHQISNNELFLASTQHASSQYKDVDAISSGDSNQQLKNRELSLLLKEDVEKEQSSEGALAPKQIFHPPSFSGEPHTPREVPVESDGSQYATVSQRRIKRSDWRGAAVAHFKGGQPETFIRDGGRLVAPWFLDDAASGRFALSSFQLKQGKAAVEVTESGLYYIYAQIHYLTSQVTNSYSLNLSHGSQSNSSVLSYCSASSGSQTLNEVSCFTSVVRYLNSTDRVFIQQRDMNRRIILRDGYSYLGVVRLST